MLAIESGWDRIAPPLRGRALASPDGQWPPSLARSPAPAGPRPGQSRCTENFRGVFVVAGVIVIVISSSTIHVMKHGKLREEKRREQKRREERRR